MPRERIVVVCGPTATGKTDLSITLAQRLNGEIVNADSRQVYRHMDVGTAKPTPAQRAAVPHHVLDVVDPDSPFTLADYLDRARHAIAEIQARGRVPVLVGGTGLYVRALAQGYDVPQVEPNAVLRRELSVQLAKGNAAALIERLRVVDPSAAASVDVRNPRRLIRAIEVAEARRAAGTVRAKPHEGYDALVLGLTADRGILYSRADRRVDAMLASGFLREVESLLDRGFAPELPAMSSLGYGELSDAVRGLRSLDDAVLATKYATHRFIRRQFTWFRREPGIRWLDVTHADATSQALQIIETRLGSRGFASTEGMRA